MEEDGISGDLKVLLTRAITDFAATKEQIQILAALINSDGPVGFKFIVFRKHIPRDKQIIQFTPLFIKKNVML